jgi:hypothetical protein
VPLGSKEQIFTCYSDPEVTVYSYRRRIVHHIPIGAEKQWKQMETELASVLIAPLLSDAL